MVVSKEAEVFKLDVAEAAKNAGLGAPLQGKVALFMTVYFTRVNGDLDNKIKICLDSLQGIAFTDDVQVVTIHAYRRMVPARKDKKSPPRVGYIRVSFEPALDWQDEEGYEE